MNLNIQLCIIFSVLNGKLTKYIINAILSIKDIENFNRETWENVAKDRCTVGIRQKFVQNSGLKGVLIHYTENKTIVESTSDSFWGTGIPLYSNKRCTNTLY